MSYMGNIRKEVFSLLTKDALLTAKPMCKLMDLDFKQHGNYVKKLKYDWKRYHPIERGSIRSFPDEVHNVFFRGVLPEAIVRDVRSKLFEVWDRAGWDRWVFPSAPMRPDGWKISKSRNKFLLFKSSHGRIRFFETGTVEIFVRKPASDGKCMQLFSEAFTRNYLIENIKVLEQFKSTLMRRCHATYKTGQRLPYMKITTFEDTHNIVFTSGDRTHPDSYEFVLEYHAEVEQARLFMDQLKGLFGGLSLDGKTNNVKPLDRDYSV